MRVVWLGDGAEIEPRSFFLQPMPCAQHSADPLLCFHSRSFTLFDILFFLAKCRSIPLPATTSTSGRTVTNTYSYTIRKRSEQCTVSFPSSLHSDSSEESQLNSTSWPPHLLIDRSLQGISPRYLLRTVL
jgi:hypothetical protein